MPIPAFLPEELHPGGFARPSGESHFAVGRTEQPPRLGARSLAHLLDVGIWLGCSAYGGKVTSLLLLSQFTRAIDARGRSAPQVFHQVYEYTNAESLALCVSIFSLLYFVGLPLWAGHTFGQGLLGLRVRAANGARPDLNQLLWRFFGCAMNYASGGLLLLFGMRARGGEFLQDTLSGTRMVRVGSPPLNSAR